MSVTCYSCSKPIEVESHQKISFSEECSYCSADIHNCKMCQFFDPSSYNECREPSAERIVEKEKRNFCEYFTVADGNKSTGIKPDAISAAEALFKK